MINLTKKPGFFSRLSLFWGLIFFITIALTSCAATATPNSDPPELTQTPSPQPTEQPTETEIAVSTDPPQEETLDATPTPSINPEELEDSVIRFVHPWAGRAAETLEDLAMEFSLSNPFGIWVEVDAYGSENLMLEALQRDVDAGEVPALMAIHPYQASQTPEDVSFVDLSAFFDDPNWGFTAEEQADIPDVFLDQFITEDRLPALPVLPQATVLFYNKSWAEELGFTAQPMDEAQFRAQSCAATFANRDDENEENDGTGGWLVNFDPKVLLSWYRAFDGPSFSNELPSFDNQAGEDAFGFLKATFDQGCIWIGRQSEPFYYFANRYALMYAGALDQIPIQTGWMDQAGNQDEWVSMGFPGSAGETLLIDGPGLMITNGNPEAELAAWLFAKYLLEPEAQAELVQRTFTLPVRNSSRSLLGDFEAAYPQWVQAADRLDSASFVPVSDYWGIAQWVLQDAIVRLFNSEASEQGVILEQLDAMILEMSGVAP